MRGLKISFGVLGIPKGQGRPRAVLRHRKGGAPVVGVYDPVPSGRWKELVLAQAIAHRPERPIEGPVLLQLEFRMPMPKGMPKRIQRQVEAGVLVYHEKRPDLDQLEKPLMDVLQAAAFYRDDAQVADRGRTVKVYGLTPGVVVSVEGLA